MIEATQADREAAGALVRWTFPHTEGAGEGIVDGQWDHEVPVQAFARHRIAAEDRLTDTEATLELAVSIIECLTSGVIAGSSDHLKRAKAFLTNQNKGK